MVIEAGHAGTVTMLQPLEGFSIGITADRRWEEQAELLRRRGAAVLHGPSIATQYLDCDDNLRVATVALIESPPDYLVATTGIGMRAWLETAQTWGLDNELLAALRGARIVARGPKAAGVIQSFELEVWSRAQTERLDEVLAILLDEPLEGMRVALQQYGEDAPTLTSAIADTGADVVEVPIYRWKVPPDHAPALKLIEATCDRRLDAVTFTSAPAIQNLFLIAEENDLAGDLRQALNSQVTAACVGPVCAQRARQEGIEHPVQPAVGRMGLLIRALSDHLQHSQRQFTLGGMNIVTQGSVVLIDGQAIELAPREHGVFKLLAERPGVVISRPKLLEQVWGSPDIDPHILEVTIGRLRRRLGPLGHALRAISGRGYRLDPDALVGTDAAGTA